MLPEDDRPYDSGHIKQVALLNTIAAILKDFSQTAFNCTFLICVTAIIIVLLLR
jgi:hypothetical protein